MKVAAAYHITQDASREIQRQEGSTTPKQTEANETDDSC